jgi:hypothetical protein
MLGLWMFGAELERLWGRNRYLQFLAVTVLTAALAQLLVTFVMGSMGTHGGRIGCLVRPAAGVRAVLSAPHVRPGGLLPMLLFHGALADAQHPGRGAVRDADDEPPGRAHSAGVCEGADHGGHLRCGGVLAGHVLPQRHCALRAPGRHAGWLADGAVLAPVRRAPPPLVHSALHQPRLRPSRTVG